MKFEERDFALNYQKQQREAGYPGSLLPFVMQRISRGSSVIDAGAGSGFFAMPMSKAGYRVTAVEPSVEMAGIMKTIHSEGGKGSLTIDISTWEDWNGPVHDASICIHSFYPMIDKKLAVEKMLRFSPYRIIIIRNSPGMKSITGKVREELGLGGTGDHNGLLVSILNELNVEFNITGITEQRDTVIVNPDDEAGAIIVRTDLDPAMKSEITEIIRKNSTYKAGKYIFNSVFCDNAYIF